MQPTNTQVQQLYDRRNQLVRCLVSARRRLEDGEIEAEDMRALERACREAQEDIDRIENPDQEDRWVEI